MNDLSPANHRSTSELKTLNAAHHIQPFSDGSVIKGEGARVITKAEGVHLWDSDGNKLLDCMAGLWCVNLGYGRRELADVAQRQMNQLPYYNTFFQTTNVPVVELAAKIASLTPGDLNQVFFANSGSEANDTNLRFVRHYWASLGKPEKKTIIARRNAYHGSTVGSASLGGMVYMHEQGDLPIPGISHISQPFWWADGGNMSPEDFGLECARDLEREIERLGEDRVAAFIAEPIQGAGGVIVPPASYWPEIQRICDKYEILLIADEVICGFGRTGNWFGSDTLNIRPDIMTIAKGLSSGYLPIAGSVVSDEIANTFARTAGEFFHGYTYSGHPVAAAVALENLRILDEEHIVETAANVTSPYLEKRWAEFDGHPLVGETRFAGMMGAIQLTPDKEARAEFKDVGVVGKRCKDFCVENGVMLRAVKDSIIMSPPLVINKSNVDQMMKVLHKALDLTQSFAKKEGLSG